MYSKTSFHSLNKGIKRRNTRGLIEDEVKSNLIFSELTRTKRRDVCFSSVGCLCNHWPFMFNLTHSCINVVTCTWCFVCDNWITMRITPSKLMFLRYKSSKDRWWQEHAGDKFMSAYSTLLFCTFTNNRVATTCIYDILSSDAIPIWYWNLTFEHFASIYTLCS